MHRPGGRLAQLVERFVYTEDVGGSKPSPPTKGSSMHRIFKVPVADVYPAYLNKVSKKGRTEVELLEIISWLTGYSISEFQHVLSSKVSFEEFFAKANLNSKAELITGTICGVKIQEIDDPLMKKIRYLDKLVDELAKGKAMEKILRK